MMNLNLDPKSQKTLYEQLYTYYRSQIRSNELPSGTKLPSARSLAQQLNISRSTVDMAYGQLYAEGYLTAKPRSGYYVTDIGSEMPTALFLEAGQERKAIPSNQKTEKMQYDFSPFAAAYSSFPFTTFRKLYNRFLADDNRVLFILGDRRGETELRTAICSYIRAYRGVNCTPDQIVVGAGTDYLLDLVTKLLGQGQVLAVENPVYKRAYRIFEGNGYTIEPIQVDAEGMQVEMLRKSPAQIVFVTPTHQYPSGVVMPIRRRKQLLSWAYETENRYIIEDDHDSEFRYHGKPIPSLQGSDVGERVIYIGTFSRVLSPAMRVGYAVLPRRLSLLYDTRFSYYVSTVPRLDQMVLACFVKEGYLERHVYRMKRIYQSRHDALIRCLQQYSDRVTVSGTDAGLYIVVSFRELQSEDILQQCAKKAGLKLVGMESEYINGEKPQYATCMLGFANLEEEALYEGVKALFTQIDLFLRKYRNNA